MIVVVPPHKEGKSSSKRKMVTMISFGKHETKAAFRLKMIPKVLPTIRTNQYHIGKERILEVTTTLTVALIFTTAAASCRRKTKKIENMPKILIVMPTIKVVLPHNDERKCFKPPLIQNPRSISSSKRIERIVLIQTVIWTMRVEQHINVGKSTMV